MSGGRAEFEATLDMRAVDAGLDQTTRRVLSFDGTLAKMNAGLERIDKVSGPGTEKALKTMQFALGGVASQAGGVVGVVGDLAGFLASGGVAGVAFAAATLAITKISEAFAEAEANARVFNDSMTSTVDFIKSRGKGQLDEYEKSIRGMETSLRNFGKSQNEILIDDMETSLESLRAQKMQLEESLPAIAERAAEASEMASALRNAKLREEAEIANALLAQTEERLKNVEARISPLAAQLDRAMAADVAARRNDDKKKPRASRAGSIEREESGGPGAPFSFSMIEEDPALAARRQAQDAADDAFFQAGEARRLAEWEAEQEQAKALLELHEDRERRRLEVDKRAQEAREQIIAQSIGLVAGATDQLIQDLAIGQDHAVERFASTMMKQAGSAMIGHGINTLAGGISAQAMFLNIPTAGAAGITTGLALIAGGLALGGAGAAVGNVPKAAGGGGSSAAKMERGFMGGSTTSGRPSSRGRGSDSASTVEINVTYGAGGPAPEDTGRAVARALDAHRRRVGLNRPTLGPGR